MLIEVKLQEKFKAASPLVAILALFLAAKVLLMTRGHILGWDEAVYLGIGKYIYSVGSSGLWEILRPMGLPAVIGWAWKIGLPYIAASEIIVLLFGIGCILMCYLVAGRLFGRRVALLASALLATSPVFFLYSSYILSEIPSAFLSLLAVHAFIRKRYYLCGAATGLAILFKFPNGLLLFAIAGTVAFGWLRAKTDKLPMLLQLVKVYASFILVVLPFLAFNYFFYRPFTSSLFDAVFRPFIFAAWHQSNPSKAIAGLFYNYSFYLVELLKQHLIFVFAAVAALFFFSQKWFHDSGRLLLGIFLSIYLAYFTYIINKDERFLALFLPAICIFSSAAFLEALSFLRRLQLKAKFAPAAGLFALASISALLLSFAFAARNDFAFYGEKSGLSTPRLGIAGPVLASEPFFSVYSDNLFIYYYFTSFEGAPQELKAVNEWQQDEAFQGIIYSDYPGALFCPQSEHECAEARAKLHNYIKARFHPVMSGTYYDSLVGYTVFVNESYNQLR